MEISAIRDGSAAWQKKPNPKDVYKPTVLKAGLRNLPFLKESSVLFLLFHPSSYCYKDQPCRLVWIIPVEKQQPTDQYGHGRC